MVEASCYSLAVVKVMGIVAKEVGYFGMRVDSHLVTAVKVFAVADRVIVGVVAGHSFVSFVWVMVVVAGISYCTVVVTNTATTGYNPAVTNVTMVVIRIGCCSCSCSWVVVVGYNTVAAVALVIVFVIAQAIALAFTFVMEEEVTADCIVATAVVIFAWVLAQVAKVDPFGSEAFVLGHSAG